MSIPRGAISYPNLRELRTLYIYIYFFVLFLQRFFFFLLIFFEVFLSNRKKIVNRSSWPIIIIYSFRIFHISVSWWFFTGFWVTANLLKSPGLFSVLRPFSIMLSFGWSSIVRQIASPPGPLRILQLLYQKHQSQLVQSSPSCSIIFSILLQGRGTYPSFHFLSVLFCGQPGQQSRQFCKFSFFFVDYDKVWSSGRD